MAIEPFIEPFHLFFAVPFNNLQKTVPCFNNKVHEKDDKMEGSTIHGI